MQRSTEVSGGGNASCSCPAMPPLISTSVQALPAGYAGDDIKKWYGEISASAPVDASIKEEVFAFAVDLDAGPNFSQEYNAASGRLELRYNMVFNQIAEGWSWDEMADPDQRDYYRFKFLPLGFETASRHAPEVVELYPGKTVEVKNRWRYEYFLAFDNLYDFYERKVDDDAGFGAAVVDASRGSETADGGQDRSHAGAVPAQAALPYRKQHLLESHLRRAGGLHPEKALPDGGSARSVVLRQRQRPGAGQGPANADFSVSPYFTHTVLMFTNSRMPW